MKAETFIVYKELLKIMAKHVMEHAQKGNRLLVAIAGPPAAGKSTLSKKLVTDLNAKEKHNALVVPLDGFHYDNAVLKTMGLLERKGAPDTFDVAGFANLLKRLERSADVAIPVFDRKLDLARSGGAIVKRTHRIILFEGNYLLIKNSPWLELRPYFHLTVRIEVGNKELEQRLVRRWLKYGLNEQAALNRIQQNDILNVQFVKQQSNSADYVLT